MGGCSGRSHVERDSFRPVPGVSRQIDFGLAFTPIDKDVTFFNRGDHGILSVRPNPQIAGDPVFTADNGAKECTQHA